MESMPMLPTAEMEMLTLTVSEAVGLAARGYAVEGYEVLLAGLQRARTLRDTGEAWGEELVSQWQATLERFARQYQIGRA